MATDLKHTPGPWRLDTGRNRIMVYGLQHSVCRISLGYSGEPSSVRHLNRRISDARLIAAAPDLLTALIGLAPILATAESNASGNPEWEAVSSRINAARAAIAKATGQ